jgi:hypothetical protein
VICPQAAVMTAAAWLGEIVVTGLMAVLAVRAPRHVSAAGSGEGRLVLLS